MRLAPPRAASQKRVLKTVEKLAVECPSTAMPAVRDLERAQDLNQQAQAKLRAEIEAIEAELMADQALDLRLSVTINDLRRCRRVHSGEIAPRLLIRSSLGLGKAVPGVIRSQGPDLAGPRAITSGD